MDEKGCRDVDDDALVVHVLLDLLLSFTPSSFFFFSFLFFFPSSNDDIEIEDGGMPVD